MSQQSVVRIGRFSLWATIIASLALSVFSFTGFALQISAQPADEKIAVLNEKVNSLKEQTRTEMQTLQDTVKAQDIEIASLKHQQTLFQGGMGLLGGVVAFFHLIHQVTGRRIVLQKSDSEQ